MKNRPPGVKMQTRRNRSFFFQFNDIISNRKFCSEAFLFYLKAECTDPNFI